MSLIITGIVFIVAIVLMVLTYRLRWQHQQQDVAKLGSNPNLATAENIKYSSVYRMGLYWNSGCFNRLNYYFHRG